jgi:hypothetical protein
MAAEPIAEGFEALQDLLLISPPLDGATSARTQCNQRSQADFALAG